MSAPEEKSIGPSLHGLTRRWFLFLGTYRRQAHNLPSDVDWVSTRLVELLDEIELAAGAAAHLKDQFQDVKHALVYCADEVMLTSQWDGQRAWAGQLLEKRVFNTHHGGLDFFERLRLALERDVEPVLAVYHRCLALGFLGAKSKEPTQVAELRRNLYQRLRLPNRVDGNRVFPEAYAGIDERPFVKFPGLASAKILLGLLALVATLYAASSGLTWLHLSDLREAFNEYDAQLPSEDGGPR